MEFSITNYYIPEVIDHFSITKVNLAGKGRPRILGNQNSKSLLSIMPVGIADSSHQNHCYNALLSNLGIDLLDNGEILFMLKEKHSISNSDSDHSNHSLSEKEIVLPTDDENTLRIVKLRLYQGWSTKSLWLKFGITHEQLTQIFRMV